MESQHICHPAANLPTNFARHIPVTHAAIRPDLAELQQGSNPALELPSRLVGRRLARPLQHSASAMKNSRSHVIGGLIATTLSLSLSASAQPTQTEVALDLDFAQPVAEEGADSGGGGALRLGQQLDLIAITLTGEAGGSHHTFGGAADPSLYALFAGGRISVGKIIEPGMLIHVGSSFLV
jgi:hypothetical protein